jgi:hypothetical protein
MQSELKGTDTPKPSQYPCLKHYKEKEGREKVVLFTAPRTGFIVFSVGFEEIIGDHSKGWTESIFDPYYGSIELKN